MQFTSPLVKGTLIKRYKRFLADIRLENGELVTAHCPNTGAMTGCAEPGYHVWLRHSEDPKRKLAYTWELAQDFNQHWIGINTHNANKLCVEAIKANVITELTGYENLATERKYGQENSRIDILLTDSERPDCFIEVKSVTLLQNQLGFFPDAKTLRGAKHLRELIDEKRKGNRAVLLFCVQHSGIKTVDVARQIDPDYAALFDQALQAGVEVITYGCQIDREKIVLNQRLTLKTKNNS